MNSIAANFGVRVSDLRNWNNISYRHRGLKHGQVLAIYIEREAKQARTTDIAEKASATKGKWTIYKVRRGDTMAPWATARYGAAESTGSRSANARC